MTRRLAVAAFVLSLATAAAAHRVPLDLLRF
jgi:hypothetical protein